MTPDANCTSSFVSSIWPSDSLIERRLSLPSASSSSVTLLLLKILQLEETHGDSNCPVGGGGGCLFCPNALMTLPVTSETKANTGTLLPDPLQIYRFTQ